MWVPTSLLQGRQAREQGAENGSVFRFGEVARVSEVLEMRRKALEEERHRRRSQDACSGTAPVSALGLGMWHSREIQGFSSGCLYPPSPTPWVLSVFEDRMLIECKLLFRKGRQNPFGSEMDASLTT